MFIGAQPNVVSSVGSITYRLNDLENNYVVMTFLEFAKIAGSSKMLGVSMTGNGAIISHYTVTVSSCAKLKLFHIVMSW